MTDPAFNLIDEPWIEATRLDGSSAEISIRQAFNQAASIRGIHGTSPTTDIAILRLLIALFARALGPGHSESDAADWWDEGLPLEAINSYLTSVHQRFYLAGDEPFYQLPGPIPEQRSGLLKLIADVPDQDDKQHFAMRAGKGVESLSLAEGARALVTCQAFDISGIKTGLPSDPRVKGGKAYPQGLGWVGNMASVLCEGDDLSKTLLLNTPMRDIESGDLPPWELAPDPAGPRTGQGAPATPLGFIQQLTWQSRRVRLVLNATQTRVVDATITYGDPLDPANQFTTEPFCVWRYSKNKSTKTQPVYYPRGADPDRAMWRGIGGLLEQFPATAAKGATPAATQRPRIMDWVATVQDELGQNTLVNVRQTGAVYGTQNSIIDAVCDDVLRVPASITADPAKQKLAADAVELAEKANHALRDLSRNVLVASGTSDEAALDQSPQVSARFFGALDRPYRRWLLTLGGSLSRDEARSLWTRELRGIVEEIAAEILHTGGPKASIGRELERRGETTWMDAGLATLYFQHALRQLFPDDSTVVSDAHKEQS